MTEDNMNHHFLKTFSMLGNNTKDSMIIEIPSIILNSLIDENGDIKGDGEIPEDLLRIYEARFPKINKYATSIKVDFSASSSIGIHLYWRMPLSPSIKEILDVLN